MLRGNLKGMTTSWGARQRRVRVLRGNLKGVAKSWGARQRGASVEGAGLLRVSRGVIGSGSKEKMTSKH